MNQPQFPPESLADEGLLARLLPHVQSPPRTRHKAEGGGPLFINRLALSTSPYLRQHAHNPVNWFPWGEEAFRLARELDRPIFLSIGYSTCHWCHVMEEESFEDLEIARYLNAHFIAVKVDREERPDVDEIYMTAVQLMTGHGGWPMTVALDDQKRPFFSATYIPPRAGARGARQGLAELLVALSGLYKNDRSRALALAKELSQEIAKATVPARPAELPPPAHIQSAAKRFLAGFDAQYGGIGSAPKFPQPSIYGLLLRAHVREPNPQALAAVLFTLRAMAQGGIHDQVGGGFHRYATDAQWLVPHFEKMLYDNAQLAVLYTEAFQVAGGRAELAAVVHKTLGYVAREMTAPGGGFFSATDADSEGEEGLFFVWTLAQLKAVLSPDELRVVALHYGVTDAGNFEGRNILAVSRPLSEVAGALGMAQYVAEAHLQSAHAKLYEARKLRPHPGLDDKILTAWNGLMIDAFGRAAWALNAPLYVQSAEAAAGFLQENLWINNRLARSWRGTPGGLGFLDDYAFLIQGLLSLFEVTAGGRWLTWALALQGVLDAHFWDAAQGGYFATSDEHEALLTRTKPDYDGAEPSGNAVAAQNLFKLAHLTGDQAHHTRAQNLLKAFGEELLRGPLAHPRMLSALDTAHGPQREVFVVLPDTPDEDAEGPILSTLRGRLLACDVRLVVRQGQVEGLSALVPSLAHKVALGGRPTVYICEHGRCEQPITDATTLAQRL